MALPKLLQPDGVFRKLDDCIARQCDPGVRKAFDDVAVDVRDYQARSMRSPVGDANRAVEMDVLKFFERSA